MKPEVCSGSSRMILRARAMTATVRTISARTRPSEAKARSVSSSSMPRTTSSTLPNMSSSRSMPGNRMGGEMTSFAMVTPSSSVASATTMASSAMSSIVTPCSSFRTRSAIATPIVMRHASGRGAVNPTVPACVLVAARRTLVDAVTTPLLERASLAALTAALDRLEAGFADLPPAEAAQPAGAPGLDAVLLATAERLRDNYPYFHPLYAGQMLKPPHPVARAAYALATWVNPKNHALDGGRATSAMEKEAVAELARMVGWDRHLGHLTGGGTMANLEALWVAGRVRPGEVVLASEQAHYTHGRISDVLHLPFEAVPADRRGRMDAAALAARIERARVGTVVATLGATATGAVDPLPEILALGARHGFRVHADAAYGGYFGLTEGLGADAR